MEITRPVNGYRLAAGGGVLVRWQAGIKQVTRHTTMHRAMRHVAVAYKL